MRKSGVLVVVFLISVVLTSVVAYTEDEKMITEKRAKEIALQTIDNNFVFFTDKEENVVNKYDVDFDEHRLEDNIHKLYVTISTIKDDEIKKANIAIFIDAYTQEVRDIGFHKPEARQGRLSKIVKDGIAVLGSTIFSSKVVDHHLF